MSVPTPSAARTLTTTPSTPGNVDTMPRIDSSTLFDGRNALAIEHAGQRYILRVTRENKLILTK